MTRKKNPPEMITVKQFGEDIEIEKEFLEKLQEDMRKPYLIKKRGLEMTFLSEFEPSEIRKIADIFYSFEIVEKVITRKLLMINRSMGWTIIDIPKEMYRNYGLVSMRKKIDLSAHYFTERRDAFGKILYGTISREDYYEALNAMYEVRNEIKRKMHYRIEDYELVVKKDSFIKEGMTIDELYEKYSLGYAKVMPYITAYYKKKFVRV